MQRTTISLFILFLFAAGTTHAQQKFDIQERTAVMSLGERTGFTITLKDMGEKDMTKALKSWLSDMQKKVSIDETGKHELMANDIIINALSANPCDIYFLFEENKNDIRVTGFFNVDGAFVNSASDPEKAKQAEKIMEKFGMRIQKIILTDQQEAAQKELDKRNSEQDALVKKNKQLNDQIDECKATISKAESDLKQNASDQDAKKKEIETQQKELDAINSSLKPYEGY